MADDLFKDYKPYGISIQAQIDQLKKDMEEAQKIMAKPKWNIEAPALFKENDRVRIEGLNDIGVIIDARPEIDTYVIEFGFSPNHVGYFKASEMTLVAPYDTNHDAGVCFHDMKEYHGFSENYRYCAKCDLKEK